MFSLYYLHRYIFTIGLAPPGFRLAPPELKVWLRPWCDQQLPELGLRKGARVLLSTPREWRAGTTASRAKGGRPGTTAVVPRRHLLASHKL